MVSNFFRYCSSVVEAHRSSRIFCVVVMIRFQRSLRHEHLITCISLRVVSEIVGMVQVKPCAFSLDVNLYIVVKRNKFNCGYRVVTPKYCSACTPWTLPITYMYTCRSQTVDTFDCLHVLITNRGHARLFTSADHKLWTINSC